MLFTLFVAVLAAALWALQGFLFRGSIPHDPSTLELSMMAAVTLATYTWMKRLQAIRERSTIQPVLETEATPPTPVPVRYAEGLAEIKREEAAIAAAEHVA
jgi:hypothetical protein